MPALNCIMILILPFPAAGTCASFQFLINACPFLCNRLPDQWSEVKWSEVSEGISIASSWWKLRFIIRERAIDMPRTQGKIMATFADVPIFADLNPYMLM